MTPRQALFDALQSAFTVALVALLLFGVSGIWPPMVAVESASMEPSMERGDLVFVTAPDRFGPDGVGDVVPSDGTTDHAVLGAPGDVVVYQTPERSRLGRSPIIHRVRFHVERGENWYERANPAYVDARNCAELRFCPAPHAGYVTKGDNNARYDQATGLAPPVRRDWILAEARFRVPWLGELRLWVSGR